MNKVQSFVHDCSDRFPNEFIVKWELPDRFCLMCKRCHAEKIIFNNEVNNDE